MNYNRIKLYRQVWKQFNLQYTVSQIAETIELIEATKTDPTPDEEHGYRIWQKWQEITKRDR